MALRFLDSFSHYTTTLQKWTSESGSVISTSAGRFGNGAITFPGSGRWARKVLDAQQTWIIGFGYKYPAPLTTTNPVLTLEDGATIQVSLYIDSGGHLRLYRGSSSGTLLATGTTVLSSGAFYYIELKVKIATGTSGTYEVHINGAQEAALTSAAANTSNSGSTTADRFFFANCSDNFSSYTYCDLYVCDGTGSAPTNDFLGDTRIQCLLPSGAGTTTQFTPSAGSNYQCVDETPPNDDTDYVEDGNIGDKDTYAFQDLTPTSGTVYGVQLGLRARKTDAGGRSIQSVARVGATEVNSADEVLSTSYLYFFDVRETKPGGGAWTISDVNSAEFGQKVSA